MYNIHTHIIIIMYSIFQIILYQNNYFRVFTCIENITVISIYDII